ncbi:hypothetical protein ACWGCW_00525 [Streptomyces sp. NPDC054933]
MSAAGQPTPIEGAIDPAAGEAAKQTGTAQAAANTPVDWAADCDDAIETMARRGVEFQAADLVKEGLVGEPDHPNRWGPRFIKASHAGVIEPVGTAQSKRKTVHSSLCHTWRGTADYREEAAA